MSFVDLKDISNCMKVFIYGLYGVSLILFASGLFIFYISYETLQNAIIEITSIDKTFLYISFVIATLLILISFLGSSDKYEHPLFFKAFGCLILICLILQIIVFIQVLNVDSDVMATEIKKNYIIKYYVSSPKIKNFVDAIQEDNKCCGIDKYEDYNKDVELLPKSCCGSFEDKYCTFDTVYSKGCRSSINEIILTKKTLLFGVLSLSFIIQLLTVFFSILLSKDLSIETEA